MVAVTTTRGICWGEQEWQNNNQSESGCFVLHLCGTIISKTTKEAPQSRTSVQIFTYIYLNVNVWPLQSHICTRRHIYTVNNLKSFELKFSAISLDFYQKQWPRVSGRERSDTIPQVYVHLLVKQSRRGNCWESAPLKLMLDWSMWNKEGTTDQGTVKSVVWCCAKYRPWLVEWTFDTSSWQFMFLLLECSARKGENSCLSFRIYTLLGIVIGILLCVVLSQEKDSNRIQSAV